MTGTLTVGDTSTSATVATIKSSNASGTYIQFVNGTTPTVEVGYNATYGAYLYNDKLDSHPTLCLGLADNLRDAIIYKYAGVNYNVWHSGSLKPYQFTNWADTRSVNHVPNDYGHLFIMRGIKKLTTIGLSDSGVYATVWGWRGWQNKSGGHAWEIASTNNDLYTRHGETTSWTSWAKILNSSNYKDYMHDRFGTSGLIVYSTTSDEINFGGTYTDSSNIYFGYNSKDNRPRPTEYHFGQNDASLHGKYFQSHIPTGTQPFQCVSTTTCTNLNADMVDGYHSNDLTKRVFINGILGGAGSKWIRIGVLKYPSAGDSNTVMITISNSYSYSMNRSVTFIISLTHHANKPIITQLNGYPAPFTAVRILAPKDSNGSYTYGDRYVDISYFTSTISGASNIIYLTAINLNYNGSYHFVPNKSFVDGSTIPSNYGEIWNFPFATGLGSNANIYSQGGLIEGGTLKLSSTSTFSGKATFNGGLSGTLTGSLSGNATTATTLQTSRTINGTSFNGSANITTSYWGTTRTIWGQSVNGSANVSGAMTGVTSITATGLIRTSNLFSAGDGGSDNAYGYYNCTRPNTANTGYVCYAFVRSGSYAFGLGYYNNEIVLSSANTSRQFNARWLQLNSSRLLINGNIEATGAVTAKSSSSDIRLKKNIKEYNALDIINKLKSVKYYWNDTAKANSPIFNDNEEHYGLIAQDLLINGYSQWVSNCFKDYYVIQYERLIPVLWRGIQQVDNEVATLKKKIATLEKELSSVKRQLSL